MNTMKKTLLSILVFAFSAAMLSAQPGSPDWIVGTWRAETGTNWEFEAINDGNEGIITISENGQVLHYWGWKYRGNDTYHVKRYYDYYESFVVYVRGNNEFQFLPMRDVNNGWILHRIDDRRPEWEESL